MSDRNFPAIYGVGRDRAPVCQCGAGMASLACDYPIGSGVCDAKLCGLCAVGDFGRDLCAAHAKGLP